MYVVDGEKGIELIPLVNKVINRLKMITHAAHTCNINIRQKLITLGTNGAT